MALKKKDKPCEKPKTGAQELDVSPRSGQYLLVLLCNDKDDLSPWLSGNMLCSKYGRATDHLLESANKW